MPNVPTQTQSLGTNEFPLSEVYTPEDGFNLVQGGPSSTDTLNSKKSSPVGLYIKDGNNVTQGSAADANTANTVMGRLTKLRDILLGLIGQQVKSASLSVTIASDQGNIPVSGSVTANVDATNSTHIANTDTATATTATQTTNANTALGTPTQTKATDGSATAWSITQLLKGIFDKLLGTVAVSGTFWQATQPVSGTFWQATQPVSGTVTTNVAAAATGGSTPTHLLSAASNNATSVKASGGTLYGFSLSNTNASARWVKFYNKASAPAPATDNALIVWTEQVPGNGTVISAFPEGMNFSTGIAFAAVVNASDTDNTSVGAGDLSIDVRYK